MVKFTFETLVHDAEIRTLPVIFERAFVNNTGINPMAHALRLEKAKQLREGIVIHYLASLCCIVPMVLFFVEVGLDNLGAGLVRAVYGVVAVLVLFVGVSVFCDTIHGHCKARRLERESDSLRVEIFCSYLESFINWSPLDLQDYVLELNSEELRKLATQMLVSQIHPIIYFETQEEHEPDNVSILENLVLARKRFQKRYDTIVCLGLVSDKRKYGYFHRLAKKEIGSGLKKVEPPLGTWVGPTIKAR